MGLFQVVVPKDVHLKLFQGDVEAVSLENVQTPGQNHQRKIKKS